MWGRAGDHPASHEYAGCDGTPPAQPGAIAHAEHGAHRRAAPDRPAGRRLAGPDLAASR